MPKRSTAPITQSSMFSTFDDAVRDLRIAHLPDRLPEAITHYADLLTRHHRAILAADLPQVARLQEEATDLALKLNGWQKGFLAGPDAPGYLLERATAAPHDTVPLWGQTGDFVVMPRPHLRVRITMGGILTSFSRPIPSFEAHIVDLDRRFISDTGYRSFLSHRTAPHAGWTTQDYVCATIDAHIRDELRGTLLALEPTYRSRLS